jgi:hypothetical protein
MPRDNELRSGFMNHDYVLTFEVADEGARGKLIEMCEADWEGDRVNAATWEISTKMSPDALEKEILARLAEGDRAVYYYLSDSKRIFRVVLSG